MQLQQLLELDTIAHIFDDEALLKALHTHLEHKLTEVESQLQFEQQQLIAINHGWQLATEPGGRWVELNRLLMIILGDAKHSLPLDEVIYEVQTYNNAQRNWSKQEISQVIAEHPYIALYGDNSCQLYYSAFVTSCIFKCINQTASGAVDLAQLWELYPVFADIIFNYHQRELLKNISLTMLCNQS